MDRSITISLKTFTFYVNEVARLVEQNRRLQAKLQVKSRELQHHRARNPAQIVESPPAAEDRPEEEKKVAEPAPRPEAPVIQPQGWKKAKSKQTKKKEKKALKKQKTSSKGATPKKESPRKPKNLKHVGRKMDLVDEKAAEPIPVRQQASTPAPPAVPKQIVAAQPCTFCEGPGGGYVCHGLMTEDGVREVIPASGDPSCPFCDATPIPICQSCYENGRMTASVKCWIPYSRAVGR